MAVETNLSNLLVSFKTATDTTSQGLPTSDAIIPPENGITLLDAKNEIFLSYLQGLALRNLNVIRSLKDGSSIDDVQKLNDQITKKLVEHRVYLERGVRPLESKIKYQVDKVVKAAEDDKSAKKQKANGASTTNGHAKNDAVDNSDSDSGSEGDSNNDEDNEEDDTMASRPNAFSLNKASATAPEAERRARSKEDGVYRPPRISATSMPTTTSREERAERRVPRSRTLDEYVNSELSSAPRAEPSIGSTIAAGGRRDKDARQLAREQERKDYEEMNLIRLPKESKKDQTKGKGRDRQRDGGGFGGEEWRGLGEIGDRIGELTKRKGRDGALERSRKRKPMATEDGQRGSGVGDAFEVKRRRVAKKSR